MNEKKIKVYWLLKVFLKILFSFIPISYKQWKKLGIFVHGEMDLPEYAEKIFLEHFGYCNKTKSVTVLEIGPGDSLFTCMVAKALNVKKYYYIDISSSATFNLNEYKKMNDYLLDKRYRIPSKFPQFDNMKSFLSNYNTQYLTEGIKSVKLLDDDSIDFIWSRAVLEHINREDFSLYISEFKRILKNNGTMSHWIDFRDHFNGDLNNLRICSFLWESKIFKRGGFYTNRLNIDDIRSIFEQNDLSFDMVNPTYYKKIPISNKQITNDLRINNIDSLKYQSVTINSS